VRVPFVPEACPRATPCGPPFSMMTNGIGRQGQESEFFGTAANTTASPTPRSPQARGVLGALAHGATEARLTTEARASLKRLARREALWSAARIAAFPFPFLSFLGGPRRQKRQKGKKGKRQSLPHSTARTPDGESWGGGRPLKRVKRETTSPSISILRTQGGVGMPQPPAEVAPYQATTQRTTRPSSCWHIASNCPGSTTRCSGSYTRQASRRTPPRRS
jgi:hypothetical protein